jgi:hypothetical protein
MAGFFGIFGRKNRTSSDSFYLSADEAKTFGDIDYMRKAKTVRRTFAKTVSGGGGESIKEVSSLKTRKRDQFSNQGQQSSAASFDSSSSSSSTTSSSSSSSFSPSSTKRTNTDTGMDMFRNMAKSIKKR